MEYSDFFKGMQNPHLSGKLEKLYEFEGTKPKLCSYRPVGGKSTLAHLFGFFIKNGNLKNDMNLKEFNRNSAHIDP